MRNAIGSLLSIGIILMILLQGCVTQNACNRKFPPSVLTKDSIVHSVEYVNHDTTITIPADSAWLKMLIECQKDSLGHWNPVVVNQQSQSGANLQILQQQMDKQGRLLLTMTALADNYKTTIALKDKIIKDLSIRQKTTIQKVNFVSGWQYFQIWLGRIFGGILLLILLFFGIKFALKYFKVAI